MVLFKAKEQPKLVEEVKMYGYSSVRKCVMKKEAGMADDSCKKLWKELNISEVGE